MKFCPVHLHISRVGSWLVCESLTRKIQKKKIFKGLENSVFKILVFLHSTTPTLQNSKFLPKLIKTLLDFYSKTSPRYFSSLLIFQFLDFVLDYLKPRVGVYFCVGLGKLTFLQKFLILLIGLSPSLFVNDCVGPMRHFEHVFKAYFHIFIHCVSYRVIVCMLSVWKNAP